MIHEYILTKLTGSTLNTTCHGNFFNEFFVDTFDFTSSDAIVFELRVRKTITYDFFEYELVFKILSIDNDTCYTIKDSIISLFNGDLGNGLVRFMRFDSEDMVFDDNLNVYTLNLNFTLNYEKK